jgi:thioredoxin reductase
MNDVLVIGGGPAGYVAAIRGPSIDKKGLEKAGICLQPKISEAIVEAARDAPGRALYLPGL